MSKHPELYHSTSKHTNLSGDVVYIECYLEYEPEELGSWSDGLQQEPNYPSSISLCYAYIQDKEISELLCHELVERIEVKALKEIED